MGIQVLLNFLIYCIINAITPGPGNLLALNTIVRVGWKKGRQLLLGIFAGYFVVQFTCTVLVFSLDRFLNPLMGVMKYIGAVYILWLAIHVARSKPDFQQTEKPPSFWIGFTLQFVNVKIYFFGITALVSYVVPFYSSFGILLVFEIIIATIGTLATLIWAVLGKIFQNVYMKHYRIINIILALLLIECVISLFMI